MVSFFLRFRTHVQGEALRQFDLLSADMESANILTVEAIILGLGL